MPADSESARRGWLSPLIYLANNWVSLVGIVVVTSATVFWLFLLPTTAKGHSATPYIRILSFLIVPAFFFLGLALIPLGIAWRQRPGAPNGTLSVDLSAASVEQPRIAKTGLFRRVDDTGQHRHR